MRQAVSPRARVVVKVGSSSLTGRHGIDLQALGRVVEQVAHSWNAGNPTLLVSSGAVAAGLPAMGKTVRPKEVADLQVAAAVGQSHLMAHYTQAFSFHGMVVGQVLLTKSVLADREQYLHARAALERMLAQRIVPIVNENDTVAVEELRLGDNDRLAALVSHLVSAGLLVLLTDTAGFHTADPRVDVEAELVSAVRHTDEILDRLAVGGGGPLGSGGVATKVAAARMAAWSGIPTVVAPASDRRAVHKAVNGDDVGTWVDPHDTRLPARKLWIAFGQPSEGTIQVDAGAVRALIDDGRSLLPVGVAGVEGAFRPGAAVEVCGPDGAIVAKGVTRMAADELRSVAGLRSDRAGGEAIHRDDLVVFT